MKLLHRIALSFAFGLISAQADSNSTNASVTITVDTQANVRTISPLIYGVNGGYGIYANTSEKFSGTTDLGIQGTGNDPGNFAGLKVPVARFGGDETSTYNWQIDAFNHTYYGPGSAYWESFCEEDSPGGGPTAGFTTTPGASPVVQDNQGSVAGRTTTNFITACQSAGAVPLLTVPMFPNLANIKSDGSELFSFPSGQAETGTDIYGNAYSVQPFAGQSDTSGSKGNGIIGTYNNVPYGYSIYADNLGDATAFTPSATVQTSPAPSVVAAHDPAFVVNSTALQKSFVQTIAQPLGVSYYILDNEPGDWSATHADAHPIGLHECSPQASQGPDDYLTLFFSYSGMIKSVNANALVIGPEENCSGYYALFDDGYDLWAYNYSGGGVNDVDYNSTGGIGNLPYLLQQMGINDASHPNSPRCVDYFSVHYYPSGSEYTKAIIDTPHASGASALTASETLRNQSTRELWDPHYASASIGGNPIVQLLPTLQGYLTSYYAPQTSRTPPKVALTEYSWGADNTMNGATTEADLLGILGGGYGAKVDLATRYTSPYSNPVGGVATGPAYLAMKLFTNYDNNGSGFGDQGVKAAVPDVEPTTATVNTGVDLLSSFAAVRSSDGALTVMVVNKQLGQTPVNISLANFTPGTSAQQWQVAGTGDGATAATLTGPTSVSVIGSTLSATVPSQSITLFVIPAQTQDAFNGTPQGGGLSYSSWFGYYTTASYPFIYQYYLGYEYVFPTSGGVYLYDYASGHFWYTQANYFPFVYDFSLNAFLYYYENNTPKRHFYDFGTNQVITE